MTARLLSWALLLMVAALLLGFGKLWVVGVQEMWAWPRTVMKEIAR
jgi:hypothetical protein